MRILIETLFVLAIIAFAFILGGDEANAKMKAVADIKIVSMEHCKQAIDLTAKQQGYGKKVVSKPKAKLYEVALFKGNRHFMSAICDVKLKKMWIYQKQSILNIY